MSVLEKLLNVQTEIKAPKGQFNKFGNYKYRSCEDIQEAVKPLCKVNKAVIVVGDELVNIGERYYIKATATFTDVETGEAVQNIAYAREEESKKGMDGSQVTGAASSYARKYALNGLLCIDDTKDSDATNKHGKEGGSDAGKPDFNPATTEQLAEINNLVDQYSNSCDTADSIAIWKLLKEKYKFTSTGEISSDIAKKLIEQLNVWCKKINKSDQKGKVV